MMMQLTHALAAIENRGTGIMFGFGAKNEILGSIEGIKSSLLRYGYSVTDMPSKEMFGQLLERVKARKQESNSTICFGGGMITLLEAIPLGREPSPMEILEWNCKIRITAFTYSPEGNLAILKAHVPCSHGITTKNLKNLLDLWDRSIAQFKSSIASNIPN